MEEKWTGRERLLLIGGVLKGALLVAGAYLAGLGLLLWLLCRIL